MGFEPDQIKDKSRFALRCAELNSFEAAVADRTLAVAFTDCSPFDRCPLAAASGPLAAASVAASAVASAAAPKDRNPSALVVVPLDIALVIVPLAFAV